MSLRELPRTAVDSYLSAVKWPLDRAARKLGGESNGAGVNAAQLAVDRADAAVRSVAATILRDPDLRLDARRREIAADERERALDLQETAQERKTQAKARTQQRKRTVAKTAAQREQAAAETAERVDDVLAEQERDARLEALQERAEALDEREDALTAADEAQRLQRTAARVKTQRKSQRA